MFCLKVAPMTQVLTANMLNTISSDHHTFYTSGVYRVPRCWETNDNPIPNWVINGPIGFSIMVGSGSLLYICRGEQNHCSVVVSTQSLNILRGWLTSSLLLVQGLISASVLACVVEYRDQRQSKT